METLIVTTHSAANAKFLAAFLKSVVAFTAKTKLIGHYEKTLGAYHLGGQRMIILTQSAELLINKYFKS